ncbi:chromosome segregation protein csm1/Pcs1 domain-containing protein [Trichoderma breve]|uniref:Chromosome segregation protein csm1/Pcs1 domain-containing protein n=1 Tax=Trichoderma breve TaxID=2034170 RepID=A0A9W9ED59_9HYPO|nr:chromosome segregation protein csm1/Pcs1 domain-containing protein [Trichoderma breve]KAJ4864519.1 chromosome segregation protein csm1/Pcs1 domain-containing protein [Trichoderma breve]
MRDRPAAANNKVTKKTRNGPRGANAKARSAKRARKFNDELNDNSTSPDPSVASEVEDEARTVDQSKSSKQTRGRPKASKDRDDSNGDDIRRQLSELKRKYSKLEASYQELQELGVKKAEQNFELLKAQAEENTRAANELIAQLKEEVAEQSKSIQRAEKVQAQLGQSETEADTLRAQLAEANKSLSQAKSETKTLYTKLAASRQIEPNIKGSASGNRAALAEKENKQVAHIKEDLYADLTGLIVRDVRRIDKEDVFDCIQTGRNGTLHFKLALEDMDSADSYEDVQFAYRPQLDASRDGDLIEALPDYLTEEITFPRNQAPKFYARVIKSLMERLD